MSGDDKNADDAPIDKKALDSLAVAPPDPDEKRGQKERGGDSGPAESINRRIERAPESESARLDAALDDSMDASDPPSATQPVHRQKPAPSSGFDADKEAKRRGGES